MKRCPECRRDYYDDSLSYCLDDGSALLEGPASTPGKDDPATAILHETAAPHEAATRAQIHPTSLPEAGKETESAEKQSPMRFVAIAAAVLLLGVGGFFGFRYFTTNAKQVNSIAVMPFVNAG